VDIALRTLERAFGPDVRLTTDHYWHLPVEAAFDLTAEPGGFTVGQLSDDLDFRHYAGAAPAAVWHDLQHLQGLIRALQFKAQHLTISDNAS
jgi:hypothetical protein